MSLVLLAAVVLAAAEPAAAQAATPPTPAAAQPAKAKPEKVCWSEKPTGSHMPVRVCVTKEEWNIRQRADQEALQPTRRVPPRGGLGPS